MPRFTGQNKKRINPRYFLNESTMDTQNFTRMGTAQDSGELEDALNAISLNKLYKIVEPYMQGDERARASSASREELRGILIDIVKSMPDAEGEEILDLVSASLKDRSSRHQRNRRFLDRLSEMYDGAPTQAEFDQDAADERKTDLYLEVLLPRAKDLVMMLVDLKQPQYRDAYNGEELIGELAAVAGRPLDVMEELLKALGEDPDDILQSDRDRGDY